jgi:hypothetical protein
LHAKETDNGSLAVLDGSRRNLYRHCGEEAEEINQQPSTFYSAKVAKGFYQLYQQTFAMAVGSSGKGMNFIQRVYWILRGCQSPKEKNPSLNFLGVAPIYR